ncbi:hypothetical protein [Anaerocolumna sp.]|uniref:hypothetical protein n=1 Tax=Anaerocolumna sp. TaxID=2041569 RepID=UPI0028A7372A|nr:hypothetical protein [Anaerocolumna sp.]
MNNYINYKFRIKKRILIFVLLSSICMVFYNREAKAKTVSDIPIPAEYTPEVDESLKAYINGNIPKDAVWVNSDTKSNFIQISSGRDNQKRNLEDKIKSMVYTFSSKENGETVYYTVLDFYFTQKLKTSKKDLLELHTNDFLRPVSPGKGIWLVRDKTEEDWTVEKEAYIIVNLSFASVYGNQMYHKQNYSRIIMSFKSFENPNPETALPGYIINYTHQKEPALPVAAICVVIILLMVFFGYLYLRFCRSNSNK